MGWSCRSDAGLTLEMIEAKCIAENGCVNDYNTKGGNYFFEVGRENRDGAITGTIYRVTVPSATSPRGNAKKSGSFRIEPNGEISRGPAFFKSIVVRFFEINGIRGVWRGSNVTEASIAAQVAEWRESYEPGGCNDHIGVSDKTRFPRAKVLNPAGEILGEYKTPMFIVD